MTREEAVEILKHSVAELNDVLDGVTMNEGTEATIRRNIDAYSMAIDTLLEQVNIADTDAGKKMTNADRIRAMSDEELAELIEQIVSERDHYILEKLNDAGIDAELYEMHGISKQKHLEWLQQLVEETE